MRDFLAAFLISPLASLNECAFDDDEAWAVRTGIIVGYAGMSYGVLPRMLCGANKFVFMLVAALLPRFTIYYSLFDTKAPSVLFFG